MLALLCSHLLPNTQAAAKLASGLVSTVWHVVDDMVVTPALQVRATAWGQGLKKAEERACLHTGAGLHPLTHLLLFFRRPQDYVAQSGLVAEDSTRAQQAARAPRIPGHRV
jgi:hypothetical protein